MHRKRATLLLLLFVSVSPLFSLGQDDRDCYVKKYFLLIQSTTDYKSALQTARTAANSLHIKLDLRGLVQDRHMHVGLSLPADTCLKYTEEEEGAADSTCYMARGRWDDGIYIGIECSNAYRGFSSGYFIVVAGSSNDRSGALNATLDKVRTMYSDAYIKSCTVWMCCMH